MRQTLLDLSRRTGTDAATGLIEASLESSPELSVGYARTIPGTEIRLAIRTGLPSVGFRDANQGVDVSKSTVENRLVQLQILSGRVEADRAIAYAHHEGPEAYVFSEGLGVLEAAYRTIGRQAYYGTSLDARGFPGLVSQVAPAMVIDDGGTADKSSVWAVRFGERDVSFVFGQGTPLDVGQIREESLTDSDGKRFPGLVMDLCCWCGLQVASPNSAARLKGLGTGEGEGLTDDKIFELLALFPASQGPTHLFMNKRSLEQLRKSRQTQLAPVADWPDSVAGVPIVATDSIVSSETL